MNRTKDKIRKEILQKLKAQSKEERARKSSLIAEKLFESEVFKEASLIMGYVSIDFEVETDRIIDRAFRERKRVAVPLVLGPERMMAVELEENLWREKLIKGYYGTYEPLESSGFVDAGAIDLVLVPGIAFDKECNRIGRGAGCYDRFLSHISSHIPKFGLAYSFQIVPSIPVSSHDLPVTKVITD